MAPQWFGESEAFWDGDELVVYTKNVRRWMMGVGLPETSDKLEAVMRTRGGPDRHKAGLAAQHHREAGANRRLGVDDHDARHGSYPSGCP